jgi:hypothetical protein
MHPLIHPKKIIYAEVAELVDAHDSGSCARKGVEVRVFSSAPVIPEASDGMVVF